MSRHPITRRAAPRRVQVFERTLGSVDASDWDFSSWVPDAVVINLGTNDWHGVPADWSQPGVMDFIRNFTTTYQQFVARLADRYGDGVEMFLGVGPMTEGCTSAPEHCASVLCRPRVPPAWT